MLAPSLFVLYLAVNLGALLLAAKSQRQPRRYLNSTAVTLSELLKLITSILAMYSSAPSTAAALRAIARTLFGMPDQMLRVAVPALLYTIQNNIIYAALLHLDAVSFQITYQLKIVAALLASRVLLKKRASPARWASVALLTIGVILVQLSLTQTTEDAAQVPRAATTCPSAADAEDSADAAASDTAAAASVAAAPPAAPIAAVKGGRAAHATGDQFADDGAAVGAPEEPRRNRTLGLLGVLVACLCSGLAGAIMELLLKGTSLPLAERNLQVAAISLVLATIHMLTNDLGALRAGGFLQGYSPTVWAMVSLDSVGGLLVSMLLKFTTATLKNFAAPIGIILNCLLSRFVFRSSSFKPNRHFLLGTTLVLLALGLYGASA